MPPLLFYQVFPVPGNCCEFYGNLSHIFISYVMEFLFSQIKKMDVVSVNDGKNLGKVCDIVLFYPENKIKGYFVTGSRGFHFSKSEVFIPVRQIVKIGEDVILVNTDEKPLPPPSGGAPCPPPKPNCPPDPRRSFDDYE